MKNLRHIHFVPDFLFVFSLAVLLVLLLLGLLLQNFWILLIGLFLAGFLFFRIFSRNLPARARENRVFCRIFFAPWRALRRLWRKIFPDRRHMRVHCPSCDAPLRLQKKTGDFTVTCPKCGVRFPIHIR